MLLHALCTIETYALKEVENKEASIYIWNV